MPVGTFKYSEKADLKYMCNLILLFIMYAIACSEWSCEPAYMHSLARAFAVHTHTK